MAETRAEAWENVAGLLVRMGYAARVDPACRPKVPGGVAQPGPVLALITCAPEMVIGVCLGLVAEEPEAQMPTRSARIKKARPNEAGDPLTAWWA
jgi:hypothetical protein